MPNVGISRSLFSNAIYYDGAKSIMNPVGNINVLSVIILPPPPDPEIVDLSFTSAELDAIFAVDLSYGYALATNRYGDISPKYQDYVDLFTVLKNLEQTATNPNLLKLLIAAQHLLTGTINAFGLYSENVMLAKDKILLQNKITDILSGKNVESVDLQPNGGTMVLTKTFTLAAIFNYYILIYGMPEYGVGFDPVRIEFLSIVLEGMGIDPYK